jgi:hypothetical protein
VKHFPNFDGLSREGFEVGSLYRSDVVSYQQMVLQLGGRIQSETQKATELLSALLATRFYNVCGNRHARSHQLAA